MNHTTEDVPRAPDSWPESTPKPRKRRIGNAGFLITVSAPLFLLIALMAPRIPHCPPKSPERRANAEIKVVGLAITKIMVDTEVTRLRDLFVDSNVFDAATPEETLERHTDAIYLLLQEGKNAPLEFRPDLRKRLGNGYMILTTDPWGEHRYVFYMPKADGDETNALDRRFMDTYMTYNVIGGETRPWQSDLPIFIACRGKDGRLELFESSAGSTDNTIGDDLSNLRDRSAPGKIEILGEPSPSR